MPHTHHTLVIAHHNLSARTQLAADLDLDGYTVHEGSRAASAVDALGRCRPGALLLGALEQPSAAPRLLRALRAGGLAAVSASLPVLTIGATDAVTQLRAYEDGSDHHVADDVPYTTLRAILAAVLRRTTMAVVSRQPLEAGPLLVDVAAREARIDGELVTLTPMEFELLRTLATDPERVFTKAELLKDIWGHPDPHTTRTLDSHACRLRRRLADHGHTLVQNRWVVGYRLLP